MQKSISLKYEPSSELLHISVIVLLFNTGMRPQGT